MSNKYRLLLVASLLTGLMLAVPAFAQNTQDSQPGWGFGRMGMSMHRNGVFGIVASINGNTLTVTAKGWSADKTSTTSTAYTVDATNAKVTKNGAASTISAITVGDTVMIQGTVNGTSVTATTIRDGMGPKLKDTNKVQSPENPVIQGNGQPVIAGTVTLINGNTLTVKNNNVTYTVDATNATVTKNGAAATLAGVMVNDNVIVQGAVSGTSVTASSIIDHVAPVTTSTNNGSEMHSGFFGNIGNFFKHLFGF